MKIKYKRIYRKEVFIVAYKKEKSKILYLLLKRKLHWTGFEFPKGGIENGESELKAVKREIKEETGQNPIKIKRFNFAGKYKYKKILNDRPEIVGQTYRLYSVELKNKNVKIDKTEHSGYIWLTFNQTLKKLTWPNQKKCLISVNKSLA
jgi:DNA polymerase